MKKMIVTLAIAVSTLSAFATDTNVSEKVLNAFKTEFTTAKEVEWTTTGNYYKATFTYNDKHVFAYYNMDGELMGLTRYISPLDLPVNLQSNIKNNYSKYWITDLFEVAKSEGTSYYITLENADTKLVLKSTGGGAWTNFQKIKKA